MGLERDASYNGDGDGWSVGEDEGHIIELAASAPVLRQCHPESVSTSYSSYRDIKVATAYHPAPLYSHVASVSYLMKEEAAG
jgi:ankyrin repeat protein